MKREIEFRAWDKNLKEIVRVISLNLRHECGYILANHPDSVKLGRDDTYMLDKEDSEVMQYTGLKDKNGVKIFEGDIIQLYYSNWLNEKSIIRFHGGSFGYGSAHVFTAFNCLQADTMRENNDYCNVAITVIGNIHQNPELLQD